MEELNLCQRIAMARLFEKALKYIENGERRYICHALEAVALSKQTHRDTYNRARALIRERLQGKPSLESWLEFEYPLLLTDAYKLQADSDRYFLVDTKYRETRVAWLKSLIEEFSK